MDVFGLGDHMMEVFVYGGHRQYERRARGAWNGVGGRHRENI